MFNRRSRTPPVHSVVLPVEQILSVAQTRSAGVVPRSGGKVVADRAVWFCACSTIDDGVAPTWLIYDTSDGKIGWCRVTDGSSVEELVDAPLITGDHVDPDEVLRWLTQDHDDEWVPGDNWVPRDDFLDRATVQDLGRNIRSLQ